MMAYLLKNRSIIATIFMYYFICLFTYAYPTKKYSVVPYRFHNSFYLGKPDLKLQFSKQTKCEKIKVEICDKNGVGYEDTLLPNIFNDRSQYEAGLSLKTFHLLLDINCSSFLRRFICSLYLPICSLPFRKEPILPCRHFCARVTNDCRQILDMFGLPWPAELNCGKFPKSGLCVGPPLDSMEDNSTIATIVNSIPRKFLIPKKKQRTKIPIFSTRWRTTGLQKKEGCERICVNINNIIVWIKVYTILCLLSTVCTVYLFISDRTRYLYPERTLVWMAGSYMIMSFAYLMECFTKEWMAPTFSRTNINYTSIELTETKWYFSNNNTTQWKNLSNISTLGNLLSETQVKNEDYGCIFYFVIQNISMMSGCLWWTMTSIASYLFISRSRDSVMAISLRFHLLTWCASSLFSIIPMLEFVDPFERDFCSMSTFLNTLLRLCCLFFFLLFKLKEWIHKRNMELRRTRNWDRKMRLFSEICAFAFFIVVLCQMLELLEEDTLDDCTHKRCTHGDPTWNNIIKVKYFMIFFPGIASFFCMSFKKKVQCRPDDDDNDNEEINL